MVLAKDIMTREVICAKPNDDIESVAKQMVDNKISGIPVVDEEHHVLGIVTESDLMIKAKELRIPFYVTLFDSIIFLENPLKFSEQLRKYTAVKVKDIMTKKVVTVNEDCELSEVVDILSKEGINRLPVVRHGKLVGIITRNDVLKALVKRDE